MYHLIRRIHLFTSLLLVVFIIMYFASGYLMIHENWFPRGTPEKTTRTERLQYQGDPATEAFATYLETTFSLRGKRQEPKRQKDGTWKFNYIRPGVNYEALVSTNAESVTITQTKFSTVMIMHGLHRLHGYGGGWFYSLWAFFYDSASTALIVFSLSGIYLWHQSTTQRLLGWICLALSFVFTGAMILYLMYMP